MNSSTADRFAALSSDQRIRLLRRLVEAGRLGEIPAVVPPRDGDGPVRLSPAQEDLWVYESLYPGTPALNLCCAYHFDRPVDPAHLEAALTLVQDHHDILRMRVTGAAGDLRLEFPPAGRFILERTDLRETGGTLDEELTAYSRRPFDLARDRLIRGRLVTVDDTRSTLVLALHHIATDWWSFDVLHTEFTRAYQAVRDGTAPRHGRPPIQYADFASWQRELEASGVFDAQLDFWRGYLARPPAPLTVGPAPAAPADRGIAQVPFHVDAATADAVRAFAREHGATVYGVLMTAFAVLAHRLSGRPDLVLGTPTANRSAKGVERVVGYVMNAVPIRWRIGPGDGFADLVRRFTADFARVLAHADVPVGRIVTAVEPERVPGRSPLFQWVFMHLGRQESVSALREIADPRRVHTGGEHDVVGITWDTDDGFIGTLDIRTDLYPPELVRHWADSFLTLLPALLARPDAPVGAAPLLTEAERRRLTGAEEPAGAAPPTASLADLVARQAERTPRATAVESPHLTLDYAELSDRADRLAATLRRHGAGPERIVALALGRSLATVVALLAVQRAGAAYLPVDPDYPADRIRHLLGDAAPALLVADAATAAALPETGMPRLLLDAGAEPVPCPGEPGGVGRAAALTDPRGAGYVIYTSGSTGRPKGVVVGHAGVAGLAATLTDRLGLDGGSRVLQLGSPSFDISVAELCMAFGSGGTLVIPPPGPLAGQTLAKVLREQRITATMLPPTVLASVPTGDYPQLRVVCVGGDACPPDLLAAWAAPGRRLHNAYGPTESTVAATVSDPLPATAGAPPIGRPVPGSRVYVLDARLEPVPVGVPGELYVGGPLLARGYLGRPELTAERFVADPHAPEPGARMYRTGDLARRRPDGQLDFLGRCDDQVQLRGFRVEPAEIEAALGGHPQVSRAVVLLREDTPGDRRLVAYLVPRPGAALDRDAVLAHALAVLPVHLVPSAFVTLDALPVTAHGKVDRARLPAPATGPRPGARQPATPQEELLCRLFAEVLGVPQAGPDDGFFELGGDSIMAIQLAHRARAAGLDLTPREVFTARTPAVLAARARPAAAPADGAEDPGEGRIPLTPVMHWWREQGGPLDSFTMAMLLPAPAGLERARVAAALRTLTDRHGTLRMRLLRQGPDDWELEVPPATAPRPEVPLTRVDAAGLDDAAVLETARRAAAATRLAPESGGMTAAVWYDAGPQRPGRLLLTVHHLAVDGVSWRILEPELAALLAGDDETPPAPGASFRRWARELHRQAGRRADELPFWQGVLSGPEARLAPDRPRTGRRATHTAVLPADRTEPVLGRVPQAFRCGPQEVLLAALLAAAVRWRGHGTALLLDLEGHGRDPLTDGLDASRTVGWFTSQHPVRLDAGRSGAEPFWAGGEETGRLLKQVKEQLRAVPDGGLGHGLLRHLNPDTAPKLADLPAPDLRFNYLGRFTGPAGDGAVLLGAAAEDGLPLAHAVELDVVAEAGPDGTRLVAGWSYPADTFTREEVAALADHWFAALDVLCGHAAHWDAGGATASDFPLAGLTQSQLEALEADLGGGDWGDAW